MSENLVLKYKFNIKFILKDTNEEIIPRFLKGIKKINNYYDRLLPKIYLTVSVDTSSLRALYLSQSNVICLIRKHEILHKPPLSSDQFEGEIISEKLISESTYLVLFDKIPREYLSGKFYDEPGSIGKNHIDPYNLKEDQPAVNTSSISQIECSLIDLQDRRFSKIICNKHLVDCDVGSAVGLVLKTTNSSVKLQKGVIMDPPDNLIDYSDIWILPNSIRGCIMQLQRTYTIYRTGVIIFLDEGTLYILKKYALEHEYESKTSNFTKIKLYQQNNFIKYPYDVEYNPDNGSYTYDADGGLEKTNKDIGLSETLGDKIVFTDAGRIMNAFTTEKGEITGYTPPVMELDKPSEGHIESGVKTVIAYDELNNPGNMQEYLQSISLRDVISIRVKGIDPNSFLPNKRIILSIADDDDKNRVYSGNYCISNAVFDYIPDSKLTESFTTTCYAKITLNRPY